MIPSQETLIKTNVASKPNFSQTTEPFTTLKHSLERSQNNLPFAKNPTQIHQETNEIQSNHSSLKAHLNYYLQDPFS